MLNRVTRLPSALRLLLVAIVGLSTTAFGQAGQNAQRPTFRAGVETVSVDVVVLGPDGRPVRGLTASDFEVRDQGRLAQILTFEEVTTGGESVNPPRGQITMAARRDVATNATSASGRVTLLVLDDVRTPVESTDRVRDVALQAIEQLLPATAMGVIFTSGQPGVEITSDPGLLANAVSTFQGRSDRWARRGADVAIAPATTGGRTVYRDAAEEGSNAISADLSIEYGDHETFRTLERAADMFVGDSRRKAFVFISPGSRLDATIASGVQAILPGQVPDLRIEQLLVSVNRFLEAARRANVAVYAIDPRGETGFGAEGFNFISSSGQSIPLALHADVAAQHQHALSILAQRTGGMAFVDTNEFGAALAQIGRELRDYYLLGIPAADGDSYRGIDVRVSRPDVVVRHRLAYRAGSADEPTGRGGGELERLVESPVPESSVPLSLFAVPLPSEDDHVPVAVAFEMRVPRQDLEDVDLLLRDEVRYGLYAVDLATGRVTRRTSRAAAVALRPRGPVALAPDTVAYQLMTWIELPPGRYQLRLSAISRKLNRGGSVYLTLDVPNYPQSDVGVSGLVLGRSAGAGVPTARLGTTSARRIPIDPTLDRRFERWDPIRLFFEAVSRDVASPVNAWIEIVDRDGQVVRSETVVPDEDEHGRVEYDVPLTALEPGAYELRVRVSAGAQEVRRTVGFELTGTATPVVTRPSDEPTVASAETRLLPGLGLGNVTLPVPPPEPSATTARVLEDVSDPTASEVADGSPAALGRDAFLRGDVEAARRHLADALAAGRDDPWIHYMLGMSEYTLRNFEEAARAWETVRSRVEDYAPVYFLIAEAYMSLDQRDRALSVLREAASRWPRDAEMHNALGVTLFGAGDFDGALGAFSAAVDVAPSDGLGHFNLGRTYHARMQTWRARRQGVPAGQIRTREEYDRSMAMRAYRRALELGGAFEWDAREALRALDGGGEAGDRFRKMPSQPPALQAERLDALVQARALGAEQARGAGEVPVKDRALSQSGIRV